MPKSNSFNLTKTILLLLIFGIVFFFNSDSSEALPITSVSRGAVMDVIRYTDDHFHINDDSVRDAMERMNVSNQKGSAPEVKLFFTPSDPKPGEKITATALPIYFSTPKENAYFTWYLKQFGCDLCENNATSNACSAAELEKCDENNDRRVTVEDWKITAMKIIAQGGFDKNTENENNTDDDGYKAHMGGDTNREPSSGYHCFLHDFSNGKNYEMVYPDNRSHNRCEHLFPNALLYVNNQTHRHATGDGVFNKEEEFFWGTDPEDPDTANNGNKDEANVAGLGIDKFTWNYMPGDQVGVAVEGNSLNPTKESDASMMIMWALPKNKCKPVGKGSKTKHIKGYNVTIPTTTTDIDDCLPDNLVDPRKGDQPQNLDINLKFSPDTPNNDPDETNMGDRLIVESHIANLKSDARQVHYKWKIKRLNSDIFSLDKDDWEDITDDLVNMETVKLKKIEGVGLDSISLSLNISKDSSIYDSIFRTRNSSYDVGYLRVYVEANEFFENYSQDDHYTNTGRSDVIIKVISSQNKIEFFKPSIILPASNAEKIKLEKSDNFICDGSDDPNERYLCYVTNNDLIGARVTHSDSLRNFHWTINGKPVLCDEHISNDCVSGQESDVIFFPIVGEYGKRYEVNVVANNIDANDAENSPTATSSQLQLSRSMIIIEPYVKLIPADDQGSPRRKLLGTYLNINNDEEEDYSDSIFQASPGETVQLLADFHPAWIVSEISSKQTEAGSYDNVGFWLDGQDVSQIGDDNFNQAQEAIAVSSDTSVNSIIGAGLLFHVNKKINENYNVKFKALAIQPQAVRLALRDIWGITQFDSQEKTLEDTVQVEVVNSFDQNNQSTSLLKTTNKIFANVASAAPKEMMFLLRIILIGGLIIFLNSVIFSLLEINEKPHYKNNR